MLFALLTPNEQWELHQYFQTTADLTDAQLLVLRSAVQKTRPSLANKAGKQYYVIYDHFIEVSRQLGVNQEAMTQALKVAEANPGRRAMSPSPPPITRSVIEGVGVAGVVNPVIDKRVFVKGVVSLALWRRAQMASSEDGQRVAEGVEAV